MLAAILLGPKTLIGRMNMARIARVSHVVLNVKDPEASAKWYSEVLGMETMSYHPGLGMAFLSFGTLDHDIALIRVPEGVETGSPGLSHTALSIDGGEEELKEIYGKIRASGAKIDFVADHGLTKSFYFFDPDGNRLEVFFQNLHGEEAMTFMRETGAMLDPYEALESSTAD
jgi:catechol 2,3-dioxygenase